MYIGVPTMYVYYIINYKYMNRFGELPRRHGTRICNIYYYIR